MRHLFWDLTWEQCGQSSLEVLSAFTFLQLFLEDPYSLRCVLGLLCGQTRTAWTASARAPVSTKAQQLDTGALSVCWTAHFLTQSEAGHPAEEPHLGLLVSAILFFSGHYPKRVTTGKGSERRQSRKLRAPSSPPQWWQPSVPCPFCYIKNLLYFNALRSFYCLHHQVWTRVHLFPALILTVWPSTAMLHLGGHSLIKPGRQHNPQIAQCLHVGKLHLLTSQISLACVCVYLHIIQLSRIFLTLILLCFENSSAWDEEIALIWNVGLETMFGIFFFSKWVCNVYFGTNGTFLVMLVE